MGLRGREGRSGVFLHEIARFGGLAVPPRLSIVRLPKLDLSEKRYLLLLSKSLSLRLIPKLGYYDVERTHFRRATAVLDCLVSEGHSRHAATCSARHRHGVGCCPTGWQASVGEALKRRRHGCIRNRLSFRYRHFSSGLCGNFQGSRLRPTLFSKEVSSGPENPTNGY